MILFTISQLHKGIIIKRPSAHIKTPYVADVTIENIEFMEILKKMEITETLENI